MDYSYLYTLSTDAAPAIEKYAGKSGAADYRKQGWYQLYCEANEEALNETGLRTYNVSHAVAKQLMEDNENREKPGDSGHRQKRRDWNGRTDGETPCRSGGKKLQQAGLVARTWGNISCRIDENHFVITPSGLDYETMTAVDLVLMDIRNGVCCGAHKPSSEKGVHLAAYQTFPEVGYVIHTHQTYATAIGSAALSSCHDGGRGREARRDRESGIRAFQYGEACRAVYDAMQSEQRWSLWCTTAC